MFTASYINQILSGELIGDPNVEISGPSKIDEGKPGTISFLANPKYESFIYSTTACAIIVSKDFVPSKTIKATLIKVSDVYQALAKLLQFYNANIAFPKGISSHAVISEKSDLKEDVAVGHFTVISNGAKIDKNTILFPQVFIGENVKIGQHCIIYPGVKIYRDCEIGNNVTIHANSVIGSDGFGFTKDEAGNYHKIPQIGNVIVEDMVEIGANTVIDRASIGSTIIKKGVKLDNLIQLAHNVEVDENTVIAAQAGVAGSTKIGKDCVVGGQVGLAGHISIADGTMIQAKSGISSDVKQPNGKLYGYPALEYTHYLRSYAHFKQLPDIVERIKYLEKELMTLKQNNE